jgi:hypothetical protein
LRSQVIDLQRIAEVLLGAPGAICARRLAALAPAMVRKARVIASDHRFYPRPGAVRLCAGLARTDRRRLGAGVAAEQKLRLATKASRQEFLYGGKHMFFDAPTPTPI